MASDGDEALAPSSATTSDAGATEFASLYASKVVQDNGMRQYEDVQMLLARLDSLQKDYVNKQVTQNVMERMLNVSSLDELQGMLRGLDRANVESEKRRTELATVVADRRTQLEAIEALVKQVEQEKENLAEHEQARSTFEDEMDELQAQWKELQKRNAQRKAAIQMTTGVMLNDEDDCGRLLETQTMEIQQLHDKQKHLEEKKIDLTTQVKKTTEKITAIEKQNERRSKDIHAKRREDECATLEHMQEWYQNMSELITSVTGVDIPQITNEFMELCVLQTHSLRLFFDPETTRLGHVEFLRNDLPADDLAQLAIRDNNVQFLVTEYRERVLESQQ